MTRLIYHPAPHETEGLYGFLLRVAEGNGLQGIRAAFDNHDSLDVCIRQRLGWDLESLHGTRLFQELEPAGYDTYKVWNRRGSRYCPVCLKVAGYWRQEWELALLTVCPEHRCVLVDVCHQCGHSLDWNRSALLRCSCGARLQEAPAVAAGEIETTFATLLCDRLTGRDGGPEHLQFLQLAQLHRLAVFLGTYADPAPGRRILLKIPRFATMQAVRPIVRYAAETLLDWPDGFHRLLGNLQARRQGNVRRGNQFIGQFGSFYSFMFEQFCQPEFSAIIYAFESYIAENWPRPLTNRNKLLSKDLRQKHIWIPAKEAAHVLGTSPRKLALLHKAGRIAGHVMATPGGRKMLCIDRRELSQIAESLRETVDLRSAAQLLGLQRRRVSQLIEHRLLGPAIAPKAHRSSSWILSRPFLQNLLVLGSNLPDWHENTDRPGLSLNDALRFVLHRESLFPHLILSIIKGEMQPIAAIADRAGMGAWVFDREELTDWRDRQLETLREEAMTVPEAARRLGLKQETAYHLLARGILPFTVDPDTDQRLIRKSGLDGFRESYVLGSQIASELNLSPRRVIQILEKLGILAVCGPAIDGSRQYLYRRDNALQAVIEALWRDAGRSPS